MPGGFLYRVFGVGKVPAAVRAELASERVLFEAEGIRAVQTFSGHVPGLRSSGERKLGSLTHDGDVVTMFVTRRHVLIQEIGPNRARLWVRCMPSATSS